MAEESQNNTQKQPGRFDKFLNSMEKASKSAGKSISHGYVKAKQYSASKMGVETTPEATDVTRSFEALKVMKSQIVALASACRGMYEARAEYARQNVVFSEAVGQMELEPNDQFGVYTKQVAQVMLAMDMSEQEYLSQLVNHLVTPLERFRDEDVEQASALKWKYTNLKTEYDYAVSNVVRADKSNTAPEKLQDLNQKKLPKKWN